MADLRFAVIEAQGVGCRVRVDAGVHGSGEAAFEFQHDGHLSELLGRIDGNTCSLDDVRYLGSKLWDALTPDELKRVIDRVRAASDRPIGIRIDLPRDLAALPWEALYDERTAGFVGTGADYVFVRSPPSVVQPTAVGKARNGGIRALVVIPRGSNLDVEREFRALPARDPVLGGAIEFERLSGTVTPDVVGAHLAEQRFDVVHFIGHGRVTNGGAVELRLNGDGSEEDLWLDADPFADLFAHSGVRLAVLNCCFGAALDPKRTLSGAGPPLIRAGVPAVVAMRYEVLDTDALRFARTFYGELIGGRNPGRVDAAVQKARAALYQNNAEGRRRNFITPILYSIAESEPVLNVDAPRRPASSAVTSVDRSRGAAPPMLPEDLVESVSSRAWVPIVGDGMVAQPATRLTGGAPVMRTIVQELAERSGFPELNEVRALTRPCGEAVDRAFRSVAAHYERKSGRDKLISAIVGLLDQRPPSAVHEALVRLRPPSLFNLAFDGLLESSASNDDPLCVINSLDSPVDAARKGPVLVNVRGSVRAWPSLVLTEHDHEQLVERCVRMNAELADLINGRVPRCLLLIGVDPRDPTLRFLVSRLVGREAAQNRPRRCYFVQEACSGVEQGYWERYGVQWIDMPVVQFFAALEPALRGAPGSRGSAGPAQ